MVRLRRLAFENAGELFVGGSCVVQEAFSEGVSPVGSDVVLTLTY